MNLGVASLTVVVVVFGAWSCGSPDAPEGTPSESVSSTYEEVSLQGLSGACRKVVRCCQAIEADRFRKRQTMTCAMLADSLRGLIKQLAPEKAKVACAHMIPGIARGLEDIPESCQAIASKKPEPKPRPATPTREPVSSSEGGG